MPINTGPLIWERYRGLEGPPKNSHRQKKLQSRANFSQPGKQCFMFRTAHVAHSRSAAKGGLKEYWKKRNELELEWVVLRRPYHCGPRVSAIVL
ncbi:ExpZ [Anopheles sinensis]|uniref:ExpZ n=1 Tax=Anopheles sinensis TaxID=74873 RepID=A0A084VTS4_ANOSI|nr:ExpZ [Anopheles sinensis]